MIWNTYVFGIFLMLLCRMKITMSVPLPSTPTMNMIANRNGTMYVSGRCTYGVYSKHSVFCSQSFAPIYGQLVDSNALALLLSFVVDDRPILIFSYWFDFMLFFLFPINLSMALFFCTLQFENMKSNNNANSITLDSKKKKKNIQIDEIISQKTSFVIAFIYVYNVLLSLKFQLYRIHQTYCHHLMVFIFYYFFLLRSFFIIVQKDQYNIWCQLKLFLIFWHLVSA